ncbi:uncharacterized protein HKW66_Vig0001370 [Vigna angularis]|uniref:Uncharacterized protein n=1 Tax=Phaseolus angularis TaxID=3914 RepID=A0A8T0LD20_PHAAN|nr:uncharacterized protein HKW66_Vig0001370 [Vigna angularis]
MCTAFQRDVVRQGVVQQERTRDSGGPVTVQRWWFSRGGATGNPVQRQQQWSTNAKAIQVEAMEGGATIERNGVVLFRGATKKMEGGATKKWRAVQRRK